MDVIRWKNEVLRWDLPERYVAGFGCVWLTFSALLAGVSRALSDRFAAEYDTEVSSSVFAKFGLSMIAIIYLVSIAATATLLATPPRQGKAFWWLIFLTGTTLFFFAVGACNLWWANGMKSVM